MLTLSRYKLLLVGLVFTTLTSCKKDFLDLDPTASIPASQALSTEADLRVALNGAYAGLRGVDMYGRTVPVLGDVMADNAYQSTVNTNRYTLYNNYTFNASDANVSGLWNTAYSVILRCNNIINAALDTTGNANVKQYKGEAYAVRALSYFTLIRYFARPFTDNPEGLGVPIVTSFDPDYKPGRSKVSEVYALINSDLDKAYSLISTRYGNSSQFSKYAAKGLQAKVYLTMASYANARTAALDVINNSGYRVVDSAGYVAYWNEPGVQTSNSARLETLFEVSSDAVGNLAFDALSYLYSQAGNYGDFLVTTDLNALYQASDVRKQVFPAGERPRGTAVTTIAKYPSILADRSDTKVLRMSEMYLIAAEASQVLGNEADARMYVNYITSRRGAAAITSTGAALFEDIIKERRKELALEGDRYMDLQRLKRDVVRSTNYPSAARTIAYSNIRRILPIPQTELDANATIKSQPNPGY